MDPSSTQFLREISVCPRSIWEETSKTGEIFLAPAYPAANVVDPTGAGDSFAGAFVGTLAAHGADRNWAETKPKEWDAVLRKAVISGCTMASFTVEDFSLHRLMKLEKAEFDTRRAALVAMINVN